MTYKIPTPYGIAVLNPLFGQQAVDVIWVGNLSVDAQLAGHDWLKLEGFISAALNLIPPDPLVTELLDNL